MALIERHEAGARAVSHYDFNNAYQYVIAREETHLGWLQFGDRRIGRADAVGRRSDPRAAVPEAKQEDRRRIRPPHLEDDARSLAAFVERWRPRVATVTHARHRTMLGVVLGESVEHQRLFEQAASGLEDVIGRRTTGAARVGAVLPTRWQE